MFRVQKYENTKNTKKYDFFEEEKIRIKILTKNTKSWGSQLTVLLTRAPLHLYFAAAAGDKGRLSPKASKSVSLHGAHEKQSFGGNSFATMPLHRWVPQGLLRCL